MRRYSLLCLSVLATAFSAASAAEPPFLVSGLKSASNRSHSDVIEFVSASSSIADESEHGVSSAAASSDGATEEDLEQRVLRLESELHQLRHHRRPDPIQTLEQRLRQQDAGSGGLFGTVEVTFLKPHLTGAQAAFGLGAVGRLIEGEYQPGTRYELGYRGDSGIGVRGRYWSYDDTFAYVPTFAPAIFGIRMDAADTEITLDQRLRNWDLQMSGGIRYGRLEYSNPVATIFGVGSATFEGVGPTASLTGRRALGNSGFSVFGSARGSVLVGDVRNGALLTFMPAVTLEDEVMTIAENQLGIAWTTSISQRATLELKTAWETQYWMNSSLSDDVYGVGSNLGFMGPTVAAEIRY